MKKYKCISCGQIIPKGQKVCVHCQRCMTKVGSMLQSRNATDKEVIEAYDVFNNAEGTIRND